MLAGMKQEARRFRVSVELTVAVTDPASMIEEALGAVDAAFFAAERGRSASQVRAEARAEVRDDLAAAVQWVIDADAAVITDAGLQVVESTQVITEVGLDGADLATEPDFASLFASCQCGKDDCEECAGYQLTPRAAAALWSIAQLYADQVYDDVDEHGDDPVSDDDDWAVLAEYPRLTWRQDAVWRRRAARAFDDLAADLEAGRTPIPSCPGEEMALHLMLRTAEAALADGWGVPQELLTRLPEHPDDQAWDLAQDVMFQDSDILNLFEEHLDGIEDPESPDNRKAGMGDYRPEAWFRPFHNVPPRDGRRGFRR